jgi:syntaxin 1B/2/3
MRELSTSISQISTLHERALSSPDASASAQLESLVTQTQLKNTQIRDSIKYLEGDAGKTSDSSKNIKVTQSRNLKKDFERELQNYRDEEIAYKKKYQTQIARQYRIVNPEATEAEVKEASEADWGNEGVFQTAVSIHTSVPQPERKLTQRS